VPTADVNGITVNYQLSGAGPRLLLCNGTGTTLETTQLLLDPFTKDFELLAHDQRGLGLTSIPPAPYEMADYAADALALLDRVGWDTCRLVGISFGGMVAQELAVTAPERVERVALLCTSPGGAGGSSYPLHALAGLPPDERIATRALLVDTRFTPEYVASHPGAQLIVDVMSAGDRDPSTGDKLRGELAQLDARRRHDVWDRLPRITCPTLVACGRHDGIAPPANSEAIASRIPGAELREYDGGHPFFFQDPAALPEILTFLGGA
jgi:pimeloyl-ACP methyl ester carboxylesterase